MSRRAASFGQPRHLDGARLASMTASASGSAFLVPPGPRDARPPAAIGTQFECCRCGPKVHLALGELLSWVLRSMDLCSTALTWRLVETHFSFSPMRDTK